MISNTYFQKLKAQLPPGVNLLAVSKGHTVQSIRALAIEGQNAFGESRLQEALIKIIDLKDIQEIKWHFIGRIQSNKVRAIVKEFDFIHSVDSFKIAKRISRIAGEENKIPSIMIQVKFRPDENKTGFLENQLLDEWANLISLPNIKIVGLMTISPIDLALDDRRLLFTQCRTLANNLGLKDCSMGMSGDWKEAVVAGSTWVRIGSALFGSKKK